MVGQFANTDGLEYLLLARGAEANAALRHAIAVADAEMRPPSGGALHRIMRKRRGSGPQTFAAVKIIIGDLRMVEHELGRAKRRGREWQNVKNAVGDRR